MTPLDITMKIVGIVCWVSVGYNIKAILVLRKKRRLLKAFGEEIDECNITRLDEIRRAIETMDKL